MIYGVPCIINKIYFLSMQKRLPLVVPNFVVNQEEIDDQHKENVVEEEFTKNEKEILEKMEQNDEIKTVTEFVQDIWLFVLFSWVSFDDFVLHIFFGQLG